MEIITINKEDFEKALPVGTSAHDEVFLMVKPAIEQQLFFLEKDTLGEAGKEVLRKNTYAVDFLKSYVCVAAFLSVMRQLDLVLTPTGFGIVSNDTVSPASKQRVDALEGSLRTQQVKFYALLLDALRSEEWGKSVQAKTRIQYLYDECSFFFEFGKTSTLSYDDWQKFKSTIAYADEILRKHISDEQMDELLDAYRRANAEKTVKYYPLVHEIKRFTDALSSGFNNAQPAFRKLLKVLESKPEVYNIYPNTDAYKLNHYETIQNSKNSTAFFFNG